MTTVQIALSDTAYQRALVERLAGTDYAPRPVDRPDLSAEEVLVIDADHLHMIPLPIDNPERVVLIADRVTEDLSDAWEAGVSSVVERRDSLGTAVMAILSASLRTRRPLGDSTSELREALSPDAGS